MPRAQCICPVWTQPTQGGRCWGSAKDRRQRVQGCSVAFQRGVISRNKACLGRGEACCVTRAREEERQQEGLMPGGMQAFMELARQSPQLIGGLPEPMVQAINRSDAEELQRIFRCTACAGAPIDGAARLCNAYSALRHDQHIFCRIHVLGRSHISVSVLSEPKIPND